MTWFYVFPQSLKNSVIILPQLETGRFLPSPFPFTIHHSSYCRYCMYIVLCIGIVIKYDMYENVPKCAWDLRWKICSEILKEVGMLEGTVLGL
jgi:hypothetical protein